MQELSHPNHYQILNIDEKAEYTEIKNAYRKLCLMHHPDKRQQRINNSKHEEEEEESDIIFTRIQAAWDCLGDEKKRMEYDESLNRMRDKNVNDIHKAQIVKLCEMKCEVCDVEGSSSDCDYDDCENDYDGNKDCLVPNISSKQNVYSFTCRCGDCFEILEEELDLSTNSHSLDCNIFECESCSLSIKIVTQ